MTLRILPEADSEVVAAAEWYDSRVAGLGERFLDELQRAYDTLRTQPHGASPLEHYTGPHPIHRVPLRRFPYAVIALVRETETVIVAVAHTRRRPFYWLARVG